MPLLLTRNEVFNYWLEKSPELLLAMRLLEKKEVWVGDISEENLEILSDVLSSMSITDLFDNEENLVSLSMGLSFSQSMMLIAYLDYLSPGLLTNLLMLSKEKTAWSPGELFIERLQLLKDADYFNDVFSSISSKWVKNLLDNNPSVSEKKEVQLLNFSCDYPKTTIDGTVNLGQEIEKLSGQNHIEAPESSSDNISEDDDTLDTPDVPECVVLTQEEISFLVDKIALSNKEHLEDDFDGFEERKNELTLPLDNLVFPEESRLTQTEQTHVFFNLPIRYITLLSDIHEMEVFDFRIKVSEQMNKDILIIKSNIEKGNIENILEVVKELNQFNDFRNHVTQKGLQGVIDAYKAVEEKQQKDLADEDDDEDDEGFPTHIFSDDKEKDNSVAGEAPSGLDNLLEAIQSMGPEEKPEETPEEVQEPEQKYIYAELFSSTAIYEFKSEQQDAKSDLIEAFIKKKLTKPEIRNKLLAKSDNLFAGIEDLYKNFPHFGEVIEYLEDYCHLQKSGDGVFYVPPTLLVGGAGVGKTFFAHELAKLVSTHFEVFDMAAMTAAWVLVGSSASWNSASPGKIFNSLLYKETMNPIFVLDEIDKCMTGNYPPENTLLPLLEQFTAKSFKDECIPLKIDASNIVWFATANSDKTISAPLKSRFHVVNVPEPDAVQKRALIANIYKRILDSNSWGHNFDVQLPSSSIDYLSNEMTSGARDLRKVITIACAKAIRHDRKEIIPEDFYKMKTNRSIGF